jgi:hypothetical protein
VFRLALGRVSLRDQASGVKAQSNVRHDRISTGFIEIEQP